jgi:hypothetical protein
MLNLAVEKAIAVAIITGTEAPVSVLGRAANNHALKELVVILFSIFSC